MTYRVLENNVRLFCEHALCHFGMNPEHAKQCSDVLVAADLRKISSHGTDALSRYIAGIEEETIEVHAVPKVLFDAPCTVSIDACGSMGMVSSTLALKSALNKAKKQGIAIATVKNANHFGFGGYYALQAADKNMLGLVVSNTASIAVPTLGTKTRVGTNPISFAAPSEKHPHFVLDMSTTVVPRGVVKRYADENVSIPEGWAVDTQGKYMTHAREVLQALTRGSGGLVPLGGFDTLLGGHKGYGLSVMVDILTGVLSGYRASYQIKDTEKAAGRSAHTFIVIDIEHFRSVSDFKKDMDAMLSALIETPSLPKKQVVFHGQKEAAHVQEQTQNGIALSESTYNSLVRIARQYDIDIFNVLR